jgi:hypothetical protein
MFVALNVFCALPKHGIPGSLSFAERILTGIMSVFLLMSPSVSRLCSPVPILAEKGPNGLLFQLLLLLLLLSSLLL